MTSDPIQLAVCLKVWDCLSKSLHLTIGVRDKRRHVTEETYEVRAGPGLVLLVKPDGTFHEVRAGGSCSCDDFRFRRRPGGCKHLAGIRLAALLVEKPLDGLRAG